MLNCFHIVKKYIDQMDYDALLAGGAPSDEFDIESQIISDKVSCDHSVQEIADIIASVFNEQFGENNGAHSFISVAQQIRSELIKYGIV